MPNPITSLSLDIYQGATYQMRLTVIDANDAQVDLGGYQSAKLQMKAEHETATVLYEASTAGGELVLGNGYVDVTIPGADSRLWDFEEAVYDLFVVNADGRAFALSRGNVTIYPSVTDPT